MLTQQIYKTLDYAHQRRCAVLIQGRTGRGKTEAARTWCHARKNAFYIDCPPDGGMPAINQAILQATDGLTLDDLAGRKATLILDECARLIPKRGEKAAVLEYLRRAHDLAGIGMAFICTDFFLRECSTGPLGEYLEQFIGRFRDKFIIPDYVSEAEAAHILSGFVHDPSPDMVTWAAAVANDPGRGGARRLWWLLEDAADIAHRNKLPIDTKFLKTVLKDYEGQSRMPSRKEDVCQPSQQ